MSWVEERGLEVFLNTKGVQLNGSWQCGPSVGVNERSGEASSLRMKTSLGRRGGGALEGWLSGAAGLSVPESVLQVTAVSLIHTGFIGVALLLYISSSLYSTSLFDPHNMLAC